jgi:hypothetical protein
VLEELASRRSHEEQAEKEVDKARPPGTAALSHDQLVHISTALSQLTTQVNALARERNFLDSKDGRFGGRWRAKLDGDAEVG